MIVILPTCADSATQRRPLSAPHNPYYPNTRTTIKGDHS